MNGGRLFFMMTYAGLLTHPMNRFFVSVEERSMTKSHTPGINWVRQLRSAQSVAHEFEELHKLRILDLREATELMY